MGRGLFKQKNGLYAVDVTAACGVMTPAQLTGLARAAVDNNAFRIKLTTRQTVVVLLPEGNVSALEEALEPLELQVSPFGNVVRPVKACAGNSSLCPRSLGDALDLGVEIQARYLGRETPKDFKIAVAGCPRGCTDPYCADFGVIAAGNDRFRIAIGGMGGSNCPRHGEIIAENVPRDKVFTVLEHVLERFEVLAEPREKLGRAVERLGLTPFLPPAGLLSAEKAVLAADDEFVQFLQN
ncbi:nitrite reductase [Desulfotomaculum copahuensis]|uniref:Nitrite reductase n=1 Tax=Desulfotomaculum copahuensis TaxID=1838280 RepID=A0A1B7LF98_9FIRM|nr:nitrite reductase [Desulfotomaculum copahuensis]OAT82309.1 nitrite reductase [Desulfotomaculum copahuensis]